MLLSQILNRILLLLNAVVVAAMLLAYVAAYVSPLVLPWIPLFSLAYPYLVALNIVFVLIWTVFKKWYLLISLLILLLGAKTLQNNFQFLPTTSENINQPSFKVMSYNVHVFDLYSWSKKGASRDSIFQFIRNESPDIGCFQEYYDSKKKYYSIHDSLIRNQDFKYSHIYYTDKVGNYQRFGIATYSKFPIVHKDVVRYPNSKNVTLVSDMIIDTDTIRVFNSHLESIRFKPEDYNFIDSVVQPREEPLKGARGVYERLTIAYKKRAVQAGVLQDAIKQSPYPVVLCGDFNDPPSSFTYSCLSENLNDSFVLKGKGKGATYSRNIFSYRIDYILFSEHFNCVSFKVPKVNFSDHLPIVGKYQMLK